jgi:aminopeptidase-like protein
MSESEPEDVGQQIYGWARDLFPICRSLTGEGTRETLRYFQALLPDLTIHEVATGTRAFDWIVPEEWNIRDAFVATFDGHRLVDFRDHNLHVVGYSTPVDAIMTRTELDAHLYSLPEQPDAIPYVTSYYNRNWGFCLTQRQRNALGDGPFRVVVDSTLRPGSLSYADLLLPGRESREILLSSYICHPSMANNELSGPTLLVALARWLSGLPERRFTYRIFLGPETIGSIVYLSRHLEHLKQFVHAGFVLTCVGDERAWSFLPSRSGESVADRAARNILRHSHPEFREYSFLDRGSDERQYCSPRVGLPICAVMRSKYGTYPEYHTSLDDLSLITPAGLQAYFDVYREIIQAIEDNETFAATYPCEPQLGRRGLYPTISTATSSKDARMLINMLAYADGEADLLSIAEIIGCKVTDCARIARRLASEGLLQAA